MHVLVRVFLLLLESVELKSKDLTGGTVRKHGPVGLLAACILVEFIPSVILNLLHYFETLIFYYSHTFIQLQKSGVNILRYCTLLYLHAPRLTDIWPRGNKTFFTLNLTEHEDFAAHKC